MDTSGNFPQLGDSDPLFEIAGYTQLMKTKLDPAWVPLTLTSPWVVYTGGGGYSSNFRAKKIGTTVFLEGTIKSGAAGSVITTLPVGYEPIGTFMGMVNAAGSVGMLQIYSAAAGTDAYKIKYFLGATTPSYMTISLSYQTAA